MRLVRSAVVSGLVVLAAACGLEQTVFRDPAAGQAVDIAIQVENHSSTRYSLLYFEDSEYDDSEGNPMAFQMGGFLVEPCEASDAGIHTVHRPFRIYLVMGSLEETGRFELAQDVEAAGLSPVLDSGALPLGATQRYKLVIQADGSARVVPLDEPLTPRDLC